MLSVSGWDNLYTELCVLDLVLTFFSTSIISFHFEQDNDVKYKAVNQYHFSRWRKISDINVSEHITSEGE